MSTIGKLFLGFAEANPKSEYLPFALKLLGLDAEAIEEVASDEEVWRTSEEGKHFRLETSTGEIKAGFGGRFNGKRIGESWGVKKSGEPMRPKHPKVALPGSGGTSGSPWSSSGGSSSSSGSGGASGAKKKDWLQNLSGERQIEAVKAIGDIKRDMNHSKAVVNRLNKLWTSGMLTAAERDDVLRDSGLEKFTEDMTPEDFVMKCQPLEKRKELTDFIAEGRGWPENAKEYMDEKLSDSDKKVVDYLKNKYGMIEANGSEVPDDGEGFTRWEKDDALVWMDLKAKALNCPTSGNEVPDEILYNAGAKERPAPPPEPVAPETPKNGDYSWYQPTRYGMMESYLSSALGRQPENTSAYTAENFAKLNQDFIDKVAYDKMNPNELSYYGMMAVGQLRSRIYGDAGSMMGGPVRQEELDRLTDQEKELLLDTVNKYIDIGRRSRNAYLWNRDYAMLQNPSSVSELTHDHFYAAEDIMRSLNGNLIRGKDAQKPLRDYILLQEKMMVGAEPSSAEAQEQKNKEAKELEKRKKAAEQARAEEERQMHAEARRNLIEAWHETHTPEEIAEMYHPKEIAGVSRRAAGDMSHDEADKGKANPLRDVATEEQRGNCQTCVIAYALRRRGYDVSAKLRAGDANQTQLAIAADQAVAWMDPDTGEKPEYVVPEKKLNAKSAKEWLNDIIKPGQMFTFSFCWKGRRAGAHVIIAEKRGDELVLFDPQPNPTKMAVEHRGEEIEKYLDRISLNSETGGNWRPKLLRIDNALPNLEYCDKILDKAQAPVNRNDNSELNGMNVQFPEIRLSWT